MDMLGHIIWTMQDARRRTLKLLGDIADPVLCWRPSEDSNSIGSIAIHIARVEDALSAGSLGFGEEIFLSDQWHNKLKLANDDWGWGFDTLKTSEQPSVELLVAYLNAVRAHTFPHIQQLTSMRLGAEVPGRRIRTVAQALSFVVNEELQHLGQMDYLRGLKAVIDA